MSGFRPIVLNAGWNLLGNALPLLAGLVAVPFMVQHLGVERFGLLSLGWVLIGYFGLFDFGLGRALTKMVAERWHGARDGELDSLCSTGLALGAAAGFAGGLVVMVIAGFGDVWFKGWSRDLHGEAAAALMIVGAGVVPTVGTAVLRGMLEGFQRFRGLNVIRVPAGVLLFVAPCISAWFTPRLDMAMAVLVLTRWLVFLAHLMLCRWSVRISMRAVRRRWVPALLRFGGWLTVSNVVGPLIVYLDRFVVGALLPPNLLAYYAAPFEIVARLLVIPSSLTVALFPALVSAQGRDPAHARALRNKAFMLTCVTVLPAALIGIAAAHPLLRIWLGDEFAQNGAKPMQILLIGFAFNALAQIPMTALHGHGLARQTAMLHLAELPAYAAILYMMVDAHGLEGAALAWSLRGAVDMLVLSLMLHRAERSLPTAPSIPVKG